MKIEIKNIKHSEFASQETDCFEATVYVDGKRSFIAKNDGQGGCDMHYPVKGGDHMAVDKQIREIEAELKKEIIHTEFGELNNSLDMVIGELLNTWRYQRVAKRLLRKVCIIYKDRLLTFNITMAQFKADATALTAAILKNHPTADILNKYEFETAFEKMDGHL